MVLWEIALGTAYFLGLKRTYRLGLKMQRRIISSNHPKIRQFALRRTRAVFDVVLNVHRKIQERDIEAGRNLGNWILRWLDNAKPSAAIRVKHLSDGKANASPIRHLKDSSIRHLKDSSKLKISQNLQKFYASGIRNSGRHIFSSSRNLWPNRFPMIAAMMRSIKPGTNIQYRQFSIGRPEAFDANRGRFGSGVMREDVMQWIQRPKLM